MQVKSIFSLDSGDKTFLIDKRIKLLELIDIHGSLSKAAKEVPISYKAAWDAIDAMNNLSNQPLVISSTGGQSGGGSVLSSYGKEVVKNYKIIQSKYNQFLTTLNEALGEGAINNLQTIERISMTLSARNQISGTIIEIKKGAVNSEVYLRTKSNNIITATITCESIENLNLKIGMSAVAIFKANVVLISKDLDLKISARNKFIGEIIHLTEGKVNSEIIVAVGDDRIVSNITLDSFNELDIEYGDKVLAIVKSSSIMIGI
ncbi:MAG: TOBE domain-containing protein [Arcobacteraceae bacterium]|nr:TOBE domain-containing protein [Arcobacteraceae bacterium]